MKRIELVYFNAGGGHRCAALALESAIGDSGLPWDVHLVNLTEILDPADKFRQMTGFAIEDFYNLRLARGWTIGLKQELKLLQGAIRLAHRPIMRMLRRHWLSCRPDLVVSLIPNFNRAMCKSLTAALPGVPYVTVLTDLADYPPNFWIERDLPQHLVCGSAKALAQARAAGRPESHIHAASGMIIRPQFYRPACPARDAERLKLGLEADRITGLVMFGGHGSPSMQGIARRLQDTQLILICGHNRQLAEKVRAMPSQAPHLVLGHTSDVPRYMQLCDFFIGKPGPGSISEALQQQLPLIVVRNPLTMPQERYNAQWIREHNVGLVLKSFLAIAPAVRELGGRLDDFRAHIGRIHNRAVFEVPQILARILSASRPEARLHGPADAGRVSRLRWHSHPQRQVGHNPDGAHHHNGQQ